MKRYLIIGNGVAGTTAAEQIRKHDKQGEITILTDEDLPFYYRIRLNEYLAGDLEEAKLIAKQADWYSARKIRLQTGVRVTGGDPDKRSVTTDRNEEFPYDALLIASGSRSFIPPIQGADRPGVFSLRTVADAQRIISFCEKTDNALLIGGGLLGLEAGNGLRKRGKRVTVVEFFPRLLPRQLDDRGAARLQKLMEEMGFAFRLGAVTKEISGAGPVERVVLESGEAIPAGMVIISAGVRPNLEVAKCLGLACDKGIIVDSALRTSRPEIFAAGDVAEFGGVLYGIWPPAMQQGKAAGINMAGGSMIYQGSIMENKLKVAGIDLAAAGEIDAENKFTSEIKETDTVYQKIVTRDHRIIGCIMLGDTSRFNKISRAITEKKELEELEL